MTTQEIQRLQDRDDQEWAIFLRRYSLRLLGYFASKGADRADSAQDLVQETISRVMGSIERFDRTRCDQFENWLFTIARNCLYDSARKAKTAARYHDQLVMERSGNTPPPEVRGTPDLRDLSDDLRAELDKLTAQEARVVYLRVCLGWSRKAIAEELGIGVGTVSSHLYRGMRALKAALAARQEPARVPERKN